MSLKSLKKAFYFWIKTFKLRKLSEIELEKDNCSTCEYYYANTEQYIGLCRISDKIIDIDNAENSICKHYKRWFLI